MADPVAAFPLRLRDPRLRALVREVARHEGVSQNTLIERALADEMVVRGRLMALDLGEAAERLRRLSDEAYSGVVARSLDAFAEGEGSRDPLATWWVPPVRTGQGEAPADAGAPTHDGLGVLAAFHAAHR